MFCASALRFSKLSVSEGFDCPVAVTVGELEDFRAGCTGLKILLAAMESASTVGRIKVGSGAVRSRHQEKPSDWRLGSR